MQLDDLYQKNPELLAAYAPKTAMPAAPDMSSDAEDDDSEASQAASSPVKPQDYAVDARKMQAAMPAPAIQSQGAPAAQPTVDPTQYMVSPEELKNAQDAKIRAGYMGNLAQSLANSQSVGNFMLGHMNPTQDMSGFKDALQQQAMAPVEQKQALLKQSLQQPEMQNTRDLLDPNSALSQSKRAFAKSIIAGVKSSGLLQNEDAKASFDKLSDSMEGMNGSQIDKVMEAPLLKTFAENARTQQMLAGLHLRQQGVDLQGQKFGAQIADRINKDPLEVQSRQQLAGIQKAQGILNDPKVTNQSASEVFQDIANILSQGKAAAQGTIHEQAYNNLESNVARAKSFLTGDPQNSLTPEVRQELQHILGRLNDSIQSIRSNNTDMLTSSVGFLPNKYAKAAVSAAKANRPAPAPAGETASGSQNQGNQVSAQEVASAKDFIAKNPKDPKAQALYLRLKQAGLIK